MARGIIDRDIGGSRYRMVKGKKVRLIKVPSRSGFGHTWELPPRQGAQTRGSATRELMRRR